MNRGDPKQNNTEKEKSEKRQFWKGEIPKTTILNRKNLKKDSSGKEKSEKGQFWKGRI